MHEEHEAGHHHPWGGECGCGGQKHGHFPAGGEHHMHRHEDDQEFEGPGFVGGPRAVRLGLETPLFVVCGVNFAFE